MLCFGMMIDNYQGEDGNRFMGVDVEFDSGCDVQFS